MGTVDVMMTADFTEMAMVVFSAEPLPVHGTVHDIAQEHHNRVLVALEIDQAVEPVVPEEHGIVQADGGDGRRGERQHDAPQDAEIPQPVDQRRLLNLIGNAPEKVDKDDKIERVDGEGHQHGRPRPHKVKAVEQQVVWDQAAGEEHRHHDHFRKELIAPQKRLGKRICHQARHDERDGRAAHRV